jgi:two-component system, OmpR family, response regulator
MSRILTVDDEADICKLLKELLESDGHKVTVVHSGAQALHILEKETFDLLLVDFFMPGMNGVQLCERIRNRLKLTEMKIAFVTVAQYNKDLNGTDLEALNVSYLIQKPFSNNDLVDRVNELLSA